VIGGQRLIAEAAQLAGLPSASVEVIRDGSHLLARLPNGVVARLGRPGAIDQARREVVVSQWLRLSGVPTVEALDGVPQPTVAEDRPVTWWRELPAHRMATPAELAGMLRSVHQLRVPSTPALPRWDAFAELSQRLTAADGISDEDRAWLLDRLDVLQAGWDAVEVRLPEGVIHGDGWQGNLVVPDGGSAVLLDLEHVAVGPPEWDLIAVAVDHVDFARISDRDYTSFVDAYGGFDVTRWSGFRILADLAELRWTCFALTKASRDPEAEKQARHRIACLKGDVPRPWTWTAL
jgi:aminoglycoside phosphotransferase (APT) family kinase protein